MKNKYSPETAGARMIEKDKIPVFLVDQKISEIKKEYLEKLEDYEVAYYIYFIKKNGELFGVMSQRELWRAKDKIPAQNLMQKDIIKAKASTDQEEVAILAIKHHLKAIPVIDEGNIFLGIVRSREIFNILHFEHVEDLLRTAGIHSPVTEVLKGTPLFLTKARVPWLILGLLGGMFAAQIVELFETSLKSHFILAAFIPLIVYIADAVGTQTETLFIRSLALNNRFGIKKYLFKEIKISVLMGLILGNFLFFLSTLWFNTPYFIGIILGISLFFTVLVAILIGIFIPWLLQKLKKDPAIGSGPFGTIIRDILSLIIYFSIASLLLKFW